MWSGQTRRNSSNVSGSSKVPRTASRAKSSVRTSVGSPLVGARALESRTPPTMFERSRPQGWRRRNDSAREARHEQLQGASLQPLHRTAVLQQASHASGRCSCRTFGNRTQLKAEMPKLRIDQWRQFAASLNQITGESDGPFAELVLGDQARLTQFGVHLQELPPGSRSSHRHWHETEDEFVFVLSGELVLVEDEAVTLHAGDAAGWRAGVAVAHCLENRSSQAAVFLVVGTRSVQGTVHYPDYDIVMHHDVQTKTFARSNGDPVVTKE